MNARETAASLSQAERERLDVALDGYLADRVAGKPALDAELARHADGPDEQARLFWALLGGEPIFDTSPVDARRDAENLLDAGAQALRDETHRPGALQRWASSQRGLARRVPLTAEQAAALFELLPRLVHPTARKHTSSEDVDTADGRPRVGATFKRAPKLWRIELREPLAYLRTLLRLRVRDRRRDRMRRDARHPRELADVSGEDVATAVSADLNEAGARLDRLIETAAAAGFGLTPTERQALLAQLDGHGALARLARETGRSPVRIRTAAWRARQKLRRAASGSW